jgi:signal transduction histidine kinase
VRRSIRFRLLAWLAAVLLPLSVAAGWLLIQVFGNRLLRDIDVTLREEAETVGELVATSASPEAVSRLIAEVAGDNDQGVHKYIVVTWHGEPVAAAPPDALTVQRSGDPALRIERYQSRDGTVVVSVAAFAAAALHAKQRLTSLLAIGIPLMLALFGGGLWAVVARALRPLEEASRQIDSIAADNLSVRVPLSNPDDEVGRMVAVLNRMLDRMEGGIVQLQRFTADAAHELRTPLTVLQTGLEVALAHERSADAYRDALAEAVAGTDRLRRLAEDLLTLARLEATATPQAPAPVDLAEMLQELADAAAGPAAQRGVHLEVAAPPGLSVHGNAGDLYRLFSNLIDNALRYAGAGGAGQILITAQRVVGHIEVAVSDNGPGVPPQELNRVFDRFYRGTTTTGRKAAPASASASPYRSCAATAVKSPSPTAAPMVAASA